MANRDSNLYRKGLAHRGVHGGKEQSVTGVIRIKAGESIATTDLLRMVPLGENVRPVQLILTATPVAGTPVLTAFTFKAGTAPLSTTPFKRPDGTEFPVQAADDDSLVASMAIPAGGLISSTTVTRPVASSVANYAPYVATLVPTAAASVAGGDVDLAMTVVFIGEQKADGLVYDKFMDFKVANPA